MQDWYNILKNMYIYIRTRDHDIIVSVDAESAVDKIQSLIIIIIIMIKEHLTE